jgi:hypothetical protein
MEQCCLGGRYCHFGGDAACVFFEVIVLRMGEYA